MAHQHAHCTGKRPSRRKRLSAQVWVYVGDFSANHFVDSGEPFRRCGGSTLHEADVDDRCHHCHRRVWLLAPSLVLVPRLRATPSTRCRPARRGSARDGGLDRRWRIDRRRRQDSGRQRPVQRRHRQRRRRQDRLRRSGVRRAARQRRGLVRDRHPGRQHRRLQAGLLLRRQLGHGRRRLPVAAQVRSDDHQRRAARTTRPTRTSHATECSLSASQSAEVHRQLPQAGAERLRLLRLLRGPRRDRRRSGWRRPAPPPTSAIRPSARRCTQVTQCMVPVRHAARSASASRRCPPTARLTAARPTPARPATWRAGNTASIPRCVPKGPAA